MRGIDEYLADADAFLNRAVEAANNVEPPEMVTSMAAVADIHLRMVNTIMRKEGR